MGEGQEIRFEAQPGPQFAFLSSPADIAIVGGAAFGGKTYGLLLEPLRHKENGDFSATIFRRTTVQIRNQGGLWDESKKLYAYCGATPYSQGLEWRFPSGARIKFAHMEHEDNRFDWKGSQIPLIGFDQLEEFTATQFWYMLSRNRSASGVPGYVRGTVNPDPDSWVREFLRWWINDETGYAIKERSGVLRWFIRVGDAFEWADTKAELMAKHADCSPLSATFIPALPADNPIGQKADPAYMSKLRILPKVEREQLEKGNWNIRPMAGMYFQRQWFQIVEAAPADVARRVRYWDRAASEPRPNTDPDASAGVKLSRDAQGVFYVEDVRKMRVSAHRVETAIVTTAGQDGKAVQIGWMQDPGSAGKGEAEALGRALVGYHFKYAPATGDKATRASPVSSQAEAGNIKIVRGPWNEDFLLELENFCGDGKSHDDQVDGLSGAFEMIIAGRRILLA